MAGPEGVKEGNGETEGVKEENGGTGGSKEGNGGPGQKGLRKGMAEQRV